MNDRGSRWRELVRRSVSDEADAEIAFHIEMRTRELVEQGIEPGLARQMAEERFGPVNDIRRSLVDSTQRRRERADRSRALTDFTQDVRFVLRALRHSPGFAIVAILTIALGIGATTGMFTIVDAALFRSLPYADADRIVVPQSTNLKNGNLMQVTWPDFQSWREAGVFESVALVQEGDYDLAPECAPGRFCDAVRTKIGFVTQDYFRALGVRPLLGRFPAEEEFRPSVERPLVLSYALWQRFFASDPSVVGRKIRMTGVPVTIVGVLPRNTNWPLDKEAFFPMRYTPQPGAQVGDSYEYMGIARLKPGRSLEATRGQLALLAKRVSEQFPTKRVDISVTATPIRKFNVGATTTRVLWVLLGAVFLLLLIACVNVANLMIARSAARDRELALRTALGAGRWRLLRQILTESFVLAAAGGALGVAIAAVTSRALVAAAPVDAVRAMDLGIDWRVLAAALAATLLTALLFGLAPALRASTAKPAQAMAERTARTAGGVRQRRVAALLLVAEVALSLTLLSGAGLLARSLMRLRNVDTGLDVDPALTFQVAIPQNRFPRQLARARFWDEYLRRLRAIPGVDAASTTSDLPFGGGGFYLWRTMIEAGAPEPPAGSEVAMVWDEVGTDYFKAVGQPLLAGRAFEDRDDTTATPKVIVSRAFAQAMFPGKPLNEVVGRTVFSWRDERLRREIVGVVGDITYEGPADRRNPIVYVPSRQNPPSLAGVIVRTKRGASPAAILAVARRALTTLDPAIAMARIETLNAALARSIAPQRFNAMLFGAFATLAVLLAAVGLYGVLSYNVTRDTREIGVRMALGASASAVMGRVLARALLLAGAGVVLGLAGSLAATRAMSALLFEVKPSDPVTFAAVTVLVLVVAMFASLVPAWRAIRVDPAIALRSD